MPTSDPFGFLFENQPRSRSSLAQLRAPPGAQGYQHACSVCCTFSDRRHGVSQVNQGITGIPRCALRWVPEPRTFSMCPGSDSWGAQRTCRGSEPPNTGADDCITSVFSGPSPAFAALSAAGRPVLAFSPGQNCVPDPWPVDFVVPLTAPLYMSYSGCVSVVFLRSCSGTTRRIKLWPLGRLTPLGVGLSYFGSVGRPFRLLSA